MLPDKYYIRLYLTIASSVMVFIWMFLYFKYGRKFKENIQAVNKDVFFMPELFFIGYGVIDLFRINIYGGRGQKRMKLLREIMPAEGVAFYYYTTLASQITYILTITPLAFLVSAFSEDYVIAVIGTMLAVVLVFYMDYDTDSKVEKRRSELLSDFPHMLSQMVLLINAGMPLRDTLKRVSAGKEKTSLYKEINITLNDINNGMSELEALRAFSDRCNILEIKKFTTTILQNLEKGSSELGDILAEMSNTIWLERSNKVRQMGEKASSKLMIPIMIIFIGILLMVMIPMFSSISF